MQHAFVHSQESQTKDPADAMMGISLSRQFFSYPTSFKYYEIPAQCQKLSSMMIFAKKFFLM